jgi:hypothetical protein
LSLYDQHALEQILVRPGQQSGAYCVFSGHCERFETIPFQIVDEIRDEIFCVGSFPERALVATSQADAALTIATFLVWEMNVRARLLSDGSSESHHRPAASITRKQPIHL